MNGPVRPTRPAKTPASGSGRPALALNPNFSIQHAATAAAVHSELDAAG